MPTLWVSDFHPAINQFRTDFLFCIAETFGPFMAFVRLWIECMIVRPCSQAIVALTFSVYVMKPFFPDCQPPEDSARMLACCCIGEELGLKIFNERF